MNNNEIVEVLEQTASLLEYQEGNSYFVNELLTIAALVNKLEVPLEVFSTDVDDQDKYQELEQVFCYWFRGFSLEGIHNLREIILRGSSHLRDRLLHEISPSVVRMLRLKKLNIQLIGVLRNQLNIRDTDSLKKACSEQYLSHLGKLSEQEELDLLEEIVLVERNDESKKFKVCQPTDQETLNSIIEEKAQLDSSSTMFWANADALANFVVSELQQPLKKSVFRTTATELVTSQTITSIRTKTLEFIGRVKRFFTPNEKLKHSSNCTSATEYFSTRYFTGPQINISDLSNQSLYIEKVGAVIRQRDVITRLSFLIQDNDKTAIFERIKRSPFIKSVNYEGTRLLITTLRSDSFVMPFNNRPTPEVELYFYVVSDFVYGTYRVLLNASPLHWNELKKRAALRGYTLTTFGLYDGVKRISSRTEERLYNLLDLPVIPETLREGICEWKWLDNGTPQLISIADIKGDMHMHTTFTDGANTVEEMVAVAISLGLSYIALTDHSKNVISARGMNEVEFLRYWDYIDDFNRKLKERGTQFRVLKGAEVDILESGGMDLSNETLEKADWVIASIHFGKRQSQKQIHARYMEAFTNPFVDVIAHPTGRMIGMEDEMNVDIDFLCQNAKKYNKCLELNSQPRRLDLSFESLLKAQQYGVSIVISTDAHAADQLNYIRYGVAQAYKAGLTNSDVLNTLPLKHVLELRGKK